MAQNRRLGFTPPTKSLKEKTDEALEKKRAKRARCRASITDTEMCKDCSLGGVCSNEATNDWLKKRGNESEEEKPEQP